MDEYDKVFNAPADTLTDHITGEPVRATPEERDAVQVMLRRLVDDFNYPKSHIQSHPQHRVRRSPSDASGSFPVDIAVFTSDAKQESDLRIVVECKRPDRSDGLVQLQLYMEMSAASIGVWFNGLDHLYLRKVVSADGTRTFEEIPNVPRFGQSIDEIGRHLRRDLEPSRNLKAVFGDLRNHLAGNVAGITRDVALAEQVLNIVFCKLFSHKTSSTLSATGSTRSRSPFRGIRPTAPVSLGRSRRSSRNVLGCDRSQPVWPRPSQLDTTRSPATARRFVERRPGRTGRRAV